MLNYTGTYNLGSGWREPMRQALFSAGIIEGSDYIMTKKLFEVQFVIKAPKHIHQQLTEWIQEESQRLSREMAKCDRYLKVNPKYYEKLIELSSPFHIGVEEQKKNILKFTFESAGIFDLMERHLKDNGVKYRRVY